MRWSTLHSAYAKGLLAWRDVEYLCEDGRVEQAQTAAVMAQRCDPPGEHSGFTALKDAARKAAYDEPHP